MTGPAIHKKARSSIELPTTFGRIGRWFLAAGTACLVAAGIVWLVLDEPARSITAGVLLLVTVIIGGQGIMWTVIQARMFGRIPVLAKVAATGRQTGAVITEVRTTSSSAGSNPVMKVTVTVDGVTRRHKLLVPVHHLGAMRRGGTLPVRVDRAHPRVLVVDWDRLP